MLKMAFFNELEQVKMNHDYGLEISFIARVRDQFLQRKELVFTSFAEEVFWKYYISKGSLSSYEPICICHIFEETINYAPVLENFVIFISRFYLEQ